MKDNILIVGGAGFVGSSLALMLKKDFPGIRITALDNLKRSGSELNIVRLKSAGVEFVHGDIRTPEDLEQIKHLDILIDCAAEPSVLAGYINTPGYTINTNLNGTVNCLELARKHKADVIFFSTSRVYPIKPILSLKYTEIDSRFILQDHQMVPGVSIEGISEKFPLEGSRSLYGASKLASELLLAEYIDLFGIHGIVNRCGVLTGPWQMGKVDQGFFVLWVAQHIFNGSLSYFGYGGTGKQVRDILHIRDLYELLLIQLNNISQYSGETYNVGGGKKSNVSLSELTHLCQEISGNRIPIKNVSESRPGDIPWYISDCNKIQSFSGWKPCFTITGIVQEIAEWIRDNKKILRPILT
ncbi:MAG: NAD-dependent epimerase/dehydratase family protein [Desulfobacterales bacterium]